jgi:NADH:ubiquinone oxidoreductase subunit 6 (subunit J)
LNLEALAARAAALGGDRRLRIAVAILGFAVVTALTWLLAHPAMFNGFHNYDDEGYMLTALKSFVNGHHLYDEVFTQYGPFYYELWGGLFSLFGISVTHDAGRNAVTVVWVLSSLLFGLGITKVTRSIVLGLGTQILAFNALGVLTNEPMHPVGLIALLLAVIVVASTFVGEGGSRWALGLLGATVAALVLTKINVGFFALVSVALACMVSYQGLWGRRWPRLIVEAVFVAIPILLMESKFHEGWARHYAVHVAVTALAVVIVLRANQPARRKVGELRWLIGGFVGLAFLSCLIILITGTSVSGLIDGVIRQPLRQTDAFTIPLELSRRLYAIDAIGLAGAVAYWYAARRRGADGSEPSPVWLAFWSLFAIGVGLTMALSVTGQMLPFDSNTLAGYQFTLLPLVWVALVATAPGDAPTLSFPRLLLPLLAVLQALHAYPVAGSQTLLATVLLVPVGALCVGNGVRGLSQLTEASADRLALAGFGALATLVLAWFVVNTFLKEPLHQARGSYNSGYALNLPGSHDIHFDNPEENELYEGISHAIAKNCAATQMEPGMDSFYLWTEQEPPSLTATGWETLFDTADQEQVIEDIAPIEGLCLLRNNERAAGWGLGEGPLVKYLEHGFTLIGKWGEYELLRREGPAKPQ